MEAKIDKIYQNTTQLYRMFHSYLDFASMKNETAIVGCSVETEVRRLIVFSSHFSNEHMRKRIAISLFIKYI